MPREIILLISIFIDKCKNIKSLIFVAKTKHNTKTYFAFNKFNLKIRNV